MAFQNLLAIVFLSHSPARTHAFALNCSNSNCSNMTITCPETTDCIVDCIEEQSCAYSQIHAHANSTLSINCIGNSSCLGISVFCPISTHLHKRCFLKGNDISTSQIDIYAINGWQDIDIERHTTFTTSGMMHCGYDYTSQCTIQNDWSCTNNQCSQRVDDIDDKSDTTAAPVQFWKVFLIICVLVLVVLPFLVFFLWCIIKACKRSMANKTPAPSAPRAPCSQIADTGKAKLSVDAQVDITVTYTHNNNKVPHASDPLKQHSRYATALYTGSPPLETPKTSAEVEVDTDWYIKQMSDAAKQSEYNCGNGSATVPKQQMKGKRFKGHMYTNEDELQEPLTPEMPMKQSNLDMIQLDANDLDMNGNGNEDDLDASSYAMAARTSQLNMQRISSLRSLDGKKIEKFQQLHVHNEILIEDVVMSSDVDDVVLSPPTPNVD